MEEPKDKTQQEINPPKSDRIGNDCHEGPNPNPGGTIDTGDELIPPYEKSGRGVSLEPMSRTRQKDRGRRPGPRS